MIFFPLFISMFFVSATTTKYIDRTDNFLEPDPLSIKSVYSHQPDSLRLRISSMETAMGKSWNSTHSSKALAPLHQDSRYKSKPAFPLNTKGEFMIDTSIVYGPAGGNKWTPCVASDGKDYFTVWMDYRTGIPNIFGSRISADGTVLDTGGIPISCMDINLDEHPDITFGNGVYFIVWQISAGDLNCNIYGARIYPNGEIIDTTPILIDSSEGRQMEPSVAFDGSNFLVVWEDERNAPGLLHTDIYGTRVNLDGEILDPAGITIYIDITKKQGFPRASFNGTNYLVVWDEDFNSNPSHIYGARVSLDGNVVDTTCLSIAVMADEQRRPDITSDGTNWLVVWEGVQSKSQYIYGTRVSPDGEVIDTSEIPIGTTNWNYPPTIAYNGVNYLVSWNSYAGGNDAYISNACINTDGILVGSVDIETIRLLGCTAPFSVISNDSNWLTVWQDCWGDYFNVYGARITPSLNVLDTIIVSISAQWQNYSSVDFDGTNWLTIWEDYRHDSTRIYGARISQNSGVLDPQGIAITQGQWLSGYPCLAFGNSSYFTAWSDCNIFGKKINKDGSLGPQVSISHALCYHNPPAISFDGTNYLVVWEDQVVAQNPAQCDNIYGRRINSEGVLIDTPAIDIAIDEWNQNTPDISFDGTNYFVVWLDKTGDGVCGARVSQSGVVLDSGGVPISHIGVCRNPCVAFDGTNYLVVWQKGCYFDADIYAARVSLNGEVLDTGGVALFTGLYSEESPSMIFDGFNYIVAWQDSRNNEYDIYGAKIAPDLTVIEEFPLVVTQGNQLLPSLSCSRDGKCLLTFSGYVGLPYNSRRMFGLIFYPETIEEKEGKKVGYSVQFSPNPLVSKSVAKIYIPNSGKITLRILDISGRTIKTLVNGHRQAGDYTVTFNARGFSAGIYFARFTAGAYKETKKLIRI